MLTAKQKSKRLGKITGSIMSTIMDGGPKAWCTLLDRKKLEIEQPDICIGEDVYAPSLEWGNKYEPVAVANYEIENGVDVLVPKVSIVHPRIEYVAVLPDFIIGKVVGENKCPYNEEIHAMTVLYGTGPETYKAQIQAEIWVTEADVCHFVSYDPRYKDPEKQLIVIEVERDDKYLELMEGKCAKFYEFLITDTRPDIGFTTEIPALF